MNKIETPAFSDPDLGPLIDEFTEEQLDELTFGVIGFKSDTLVCHYNTTESKYAALSRERVIGHALFTTVAPCMNNFLVAQRFEDCLAAGTSLDDTIDYVLTLRMRPIKVKLRLIAGPHLAASYVLILRP